MIRINNIGRDVSLILKYHKDTLGPEILVRLKRNSCTLPKYLKQWLELNLNEILNATPSRLIELHNEFYTTNRAKGNVSSVNKRLSAVFKYDWFANKKRLENKTNKYCTYILAHQLNVNVCPYCNRNRTFSIFKETGKALIRPEFDHFFSQTDFPLLALSFYNLIPACHTCNSTLKGSEEFDLATHCHPYFDEFGEACKFIYEAKSYDSALGLNSDINIDMKLNAKAGRGIKKKIKGNQETFELVTVYKRYKDDVAEIVYKCLEADDDYFNSLKRSYPKIGNQNDLYRLAFGNYFDPENFEKRPLAKLTRDIVDQTEVLKLSKK